MKNVLVLLCFALYALALDAQINDLKSHQSTGADPTALKIKFLPVDALALPNGDIQIGVALQATVKNIGTQAYTTPMPMVLKQLVNGTYVPVKQIIVPVLNAGGTASFNFFTSYVLGKEQPPTFILEAHAKNKGIPTPDVNLQNNRQKATAL